MEQDFNTSPISNLEGATAGGKASTTDELTLPFIVWLRGDEEHCQDFVIDAEEAMDQLGIKRSRLTQISGKELRVGRIRSGRYIRPVYRQQDLDEYKKWTRPTASHQKSSEQIEAATQALREQTHSLEEKFTELTEDFGQDLSQSVKNTAIETQRAVENNRQKLEDNQVSLTQSLIERLESNEKSIESLSSKLEQTLDILKSIPLLTQEVANLADTCHETLLQTNTNEKSISETTNSLLGKIESLESVVETVEERHALRLKHTLKSIEGYFAPKPPKRKAVRRLRLRQREEKRKSPRPFNKARSRALKFRGFQIR